jgi:hypothetical protein
MPDQGAEASSSPGDDGALWQARVVDTIEDVVSAVHDRVIRPLLVVARAIVFGTIVATMALVVSILLSVALVRLLDVYAFGGRVWASDALVGGIFTVGGLVAWTMRRARGDTGTR